MVLFVPYLANKGSEGQAFSIRRFTMSRNVLMCLNMLELSNPSYTKIPAGLFFDPEYLCKQERQILTASVVYKYIEIGNNLLGTQMRINFVLNHNSANFRRCYWCCPYGANTVLSFKTFLGNGLALCQKLQILRKII